MSIKYIFQFHFFNFFNEKKNMARISVLDIYLAQLTPFIRRPTATMIFTEM